MMNKSPVEGKLICVALNDKHQLESLADSFSQPPYGNPPLEPVLYYKPRNTWSCDGAVVPWPEDEHRQPFPELVVGSSLGVVIGKRTCRVRPEEALNHIRGYTIVHDFSLPETSYFRPDIVGKCRDGSAPVGPDIVPADKVGEPRSLKVQTKINGIVKAELPMSRLYRATEELISLISHIMTIQPGEIIAVGFAGERLPVNPGDVAATHIPGIGILSNRAGGA